MNINDLVALGATANSSVVKKTISWKQKKEEHTFDVFIKKEMSAADFEFIYTNRKEDDTIMARRVTRLIFLGEKGEESIPYETASSMRWDLLLAMCKAINEVHGDDSADEGDSEKN